MSKFGRGICISHQSNITEIPLEAQYTVSGHVSVRLPFKLLNAAAAWKSSEWDLISLSQKWPILENVLTLDNSKGSNIFVVSDHSELGGLINSENLHSNAQILDEFWFADFIEEMTNKSRKYFYSTNYRVFEGITNTENDTNWRSLTVHEEAHFPPSAKNVSAPLTPPQLWLLSANSSLQMRYSEFHTMRIQLHGTARYSLFSPEYAKNLYPYPSIHDSARQSQVDFSSTDCSEFNTMTQTQTQECPAHNPRSQFPRFTETPCTVVELNAGEVLYIPPYWFAHTEAGSSLAIGLDVLSTSPEQLVLLEAHSVGLPFKGLDLTKKTVRVFASQIYLVHVLSRIHGVSNPRKYARALYRSRYSYIYPENGMYLQSARLPGGFQCLAQEGDVLREVVKILRDGPEGGSGGGQVERVADFVAERVNHRSISAGQRWLWLGNYVEQIARWAMGDPEEAVLFIRECLNQDSKLEVVVEEEGPPVMTLNPQED